MAQFEQKYVIQCSASLVFKVFSDTDSWTRCTNIKQVQWIAGKPWQAQSRMRVEYGGPMPTSLEQSILLYEPESRITYLSHFFGVTLETRLLFRPKKVTSTELTVWMESIGTSSRNLEGGIDRLIESETANFYQKMKAECERLGAGVQSRREPA